MAPKKPRPKPKKKAAKPAERPPGELSERQRRWVEAYMGAAAANGTEACRIAGYRGSDTALAVQAGRLLRNAKVRAAIELRVSEDPAIATRQARQHFWTQVMLGHGDFRKARMGDRLKASELLGKSQGDFVERHEHRFPKPPSLTVRVKT